ncbi:uncharacterized protein [Epargyreus clarus]|uniref:uncharacterized protein isoform X2 n=1 Tax=Epargyreus clarus TaxID=520877 RepID=UPI003C2E0E55
MFYAVFLRRCVYVLVILLWLVLCYIEGSPRIKFKRKVDSPNVGNKLQEKSLVAEKRGFFSHGGLFSIGKVLNFFPVGGERECQPSGYTVARAGICLNPYDCRQRDGRASGDCAHGLGVCCVFEVTCGGLVQNNLTYFMSPGFPELWSNDSDCDITIEKTHAGIMQLRIDFVHFTIGQPNRTTGECDEDVMILGEGANNFTICGQNHGQHVYYTLPSASETREAGEFPRPRATRLSLRARGGDALWLLRLAQVPLAHSAPHGCLQHYTSDNGTIKTFNYAVNGRHLASQEYKACVRRNVGFCSIRYTPCDARSFRIGPGGDVPAVIDPAETMPPEQIMPVNDQMQDEEEGSGADPQLAPSMETPPAQQGFMSRRSFWSRWSPYAQHYDDDEFRYYGYGNYGVGLQGYGRQRCKDRITIPCENEYFLGSGPLSTPGVCDPHHCGSTLCPGVGFPQCRVDSALTPFAVAVHFGPPTPKPSPEDNIGVCLRYTQIPCTA